MYGSQVGAGGRRPGAEHSPISEDEELDSTERACDTLLMCIVTVMNHGLRNGGGVGDILRKPSKDVSTLLRSRFHRAWLLSNSQC